MINNPAQVSPAPPLSRLQRLTRPRQAEARCELCSAAIGAEHQHLLDLNSRQLLCACDACAVLFSDQAHPRYRRVSRRVQLLRDLDGTDELCAALQIPINLAFFYHSSQAGRVVANYPSPAGATESLLSMDAWEELAARSPALRRMTSDTEALLVNFVRGRRDCFLVSIDECYKLVGLIRSNWRGITGGPEVWQAVEAFFDNLHRRAAGTAPGGARA